MRASVNGTGTIHQKDQSKALFVLISEMNMLIALTRVKIGRDFQLKDAFGKKYFSEILSYGLH